MERDETTDWRVRLTARRESPPAGQALRTVMFPLRATPQMNPRARAQHFSNLTAGRTVRPSRSAATGQRRVMVKARVVKMTPGAAKALMTHVRYVERDGVGPVGEDGRFFSKDADVADGKAFAERCVGDRHHFRIIVNPEDGRELPDLKAYARSFMHRVERDMGTSIDWIGGEHHDTGRPHLHLLLRGKRDDGRDLVLPRDYVSHGLRGRAQELATEILGPRLEQASTREQDLTANRFTAIDRSLISASREGQLTIGDLSGLDGPNALRRLTHLEKEGLITRERAGHWRIPGNLRETLQNLGEREARDTAVGKALWGTDLASDTARLEPVVVSPGKPLVGAYVGHAPIGPKTDGPQVVVVDLMDGRLGHVRMPSRESLLALDRVPEGAVVQLWSTAPTSRPSDLTIAEIAGERDGIYSAEDHRLARPGDRDNFIERHVRRLEAMSREGVCDALDQGRFSIPANYADAAMKIDQLKQHGTVAHIRVLDDRPLSQQVTAQVRTWLDNTLSGGKPPELGNAGFGVKVQDGLRERAEHLRGLGMGSGQAFTLSAGDMTQLRSREVQAVFEGLGFPNKSVSLAREGQRFSGVYLSRVHVGGNAYAVVEGKAGIVLAPWRAALEACRGQALTGVLQGGAVDFTFGKSAARGLGLEL